MGRRRNPIDDDGPVGKFAQRLRDRVDAVKPTPTFRAMANLSSFSHAVLAEACAGKKMPTWKVTEAFVRTCGATDAEVDEWREDWLQTQRAVGRLRRKLGEADVVVPTRTNAGVPLREGRLRPVQVDLADPASSIPRPGTVQTFDDLLYQLQVLKIAVGNPSLRQLQAQLRKLHLYLGVSTLSELFSGRRLLTHDHYAEVIRGLLSYATGVSEQRQSWHTPQDWLDAWSRAEYNRVRPDLSRRRRVGNIYLLSENQDEGPTAAIVGELDPALAAALLSSLHPPIAAGIIGELPPEKAQAVLRAMWQLSGTVDNHRRTANGTVLPYSKSGPGVGTDITKSPSHYDADQQTSSPEDE